MNEPQSWSVAIGTAGEWGQPVLQNIDVDGSIDQSADIRRDRLNFIAGINRILRRDRRSVICSCLRCGDDARAHDEAERNDQTAWRFGMRH